MKKITDLNSVKAMARMFVMLEVPPVIIISVISVLLIP